MTKFTKGPWKPGRNPAIATMLDGKEGKAIYPEDGYHHIAWANIHDEDGELDMEMALANAALIAAAPSLYNALEGACKEFCKLCPAFDFSKLACGGKTGKCFCDKWMQVLAKARGEEEG